MKPKFAKVGDIKYPIASDFRVALECNKIAENEEINDYERALAIIYKLFGDRGLEDKHNHERLKELAEKYLRREEEVPKSGNKEPDMDFEQDKGKISASFFSVYGIRDIFGIDYMHFYEFQDLMNGLTEDCILNYARYVRNYDTSQIKDPKERKYWEEQKELFALKKKKPKLSEEQQKIIDKYKKQAKQI